MSFISGHTENYVQINIPIAEARKMLKKDEEALSLLAYWIDKYVTLIDNIKQINTKRILETDWTQPS